MKEGSKYQPLLEFLHGSNQREVILTFAELHEEERCLFFPIGAVQRGRKEFPKTSTFTLPDYWMEGSSSNPRELFHRIGTKKAENYS